MFGLGIGEIVVVLVIALIFIGPKKLPGLAKGLGKGLREFQNALGGITDQIKNPQSQVKTELVEDPKVNEELTPKANDNLSDNELIEDKKADF